MTTSATTATTPSSDQAMSNIAAYPLVKRKRRRGNPAPDWGIAPGETAGGASVMRGLVGRGTGIGAAPRRLALLVDHRRLGRSEEHTSELQSLMRISYAVFCLKKKTNTLQNQKNK